MVECLKQNGMCPIECPARIIFNKHLEMGILYQDAIKIAKDKGCKNYDPRITYIFDSLSNQIVAINIEGTVISPVSKLK